MDRDSTPAAAGQLDHYRQRDLTNSHLYRLGTKIFGSEPPRHRIVDSLDFQPSHRSPHGANLRRTWDGRPLIAARPRAARPLLARRHSMQSLTHAKIAETDDIATEEYREWIEQRKALRAGLDEMGISERWLCSKTRTPLENNFLAEIRDRRKKTIARDQTKPSESEVEKSTSKSAILLDSAVERRQARLREKRHMLKVTIALITCLTHGKQRFVTLLQLRDRAGENCLPAEQLGDVIRKMRPPITQDALDFILNCLPSVRDGKLDYRPLINGDILQHVEDYFKSINERRDEDNVYQITEKIDSESIDGDSSCQEERGSRRSTLGEKLGHLCVEYQEEELKQFEALLDFCKERGITLDENLLNRVLLLPSDNSQKSCLASFKPPGFQDLLHKDFFAPAEDVVKAPRAVNIREKFGGAYRELNLKARRKLKTERCGANAEKGKVEKNKHLDCWLTFKEYKKWTEHVRSRPDFHYKYNGLSNSNAFWPGALLDKLRLWMPRETLADKPCSLYNIFQPVSHPKIYNPCQPAARQREGWPENQRGYIQFGGQTRKTYAL